MGSFEAMPFYSTLAKHDPQPRESGRNDPRDDGPKREFEHEEIIRRVGPAICHRGSHGKSNGKEDDDEDRAQGYSKGREAGCESDREDYREGKIEVRKGLKGRHLGHPAVRSWGIPPKWRHRQ
jgi:hypothetical protein